MSVNALLEEFKVKAATPKQQLAEYKAQGKKSSWCSSLLRSGRACICRWYRSDGYVGFQH